jgi:hypothetical protein
VGIGYASRGALVYFDFLPVVIKPGEKVLDSMILATPGHFQALYQGTDTLVELALGVKQGIGKIQFALNGKLAEYFYLPE